MSRTKVTKEALIRLYVNDPTATYESVAKKLDSSRAAVAKAMKRLGVESRNTAGRPRVDISELSDQEWLEQKFITEMMSATAIAKILDVSQTTVLNALKKYAIDTSRPENPLLYDKDWLEEQYLTKQRTYEDIGNEIGVTKYGVYHAMQRYGIKARNHSSQHLQLNDKEWLRKMYVNELLSTKQIADLIGATVGAVGSSLIHMGIKLRSAKEGWHTRFPDGRHDKDTPNWRGGISPENMRIRSSQEYKLWRKAVFERDNYTCRFCGARNGNGKTIILHADHIKPFAFFPELQFDIGNGRTLCIDCHRKTDTYGAKRKDQYS